MKSLNLEIIKWLSTIIIFSVSLVACGGGVGTTTILNPTPSTAYTITASAGSGGAITPSGTTSVPQGASQTYTITPSTGYIISTILLDGASVALASTKTFTNVQSNRTISATFSAAPAGGIVISLVPSRTSGVAPLSVFFDATATADTGVTNRPFHDLEYRWSFEDAGAETWAHGAQPGVSSKNSATGAVSSHVFKTPGTYTVSLTVFDGVNSSSTTTLITVQDPNNVFAGTNTICVAQLIMPVAGSNGCPAGALTVIQPSFPTAISTYALTGKRVLFKRGDTFSAATSGVLNRTGPGTLGAFGTGSAPKVQMTGNTAILMLSSRDTPNIKDWRIMDLEFDGMNKVDCVAIDAGGGINQVLILNMNIYHAAIGIGLDGALVQAHYLFGLTGHGMYDDIAIVDSTITPRFNAPDGWEIYASATRFAIQGNTLGNTLNNSSMGSHVVRIPYAEKAVIANNTIARPGANQLAIKLHSEAWCESTSPAGTCTSYDSLPPPPIYNYNNNTHPIGVYAALSGYTEKIIVSDNKLIGADNPYTMSVASQNLHSDERMRNIIVERNWFVSGGATQLSILFNATDITVRNNIADMALGSYKTFASVFNPGTAPPSTNVKILNNTIYGGSGVGSEFFGVFIDPRATNVTVVNNLLSAPSSLNPVVIDGTGASPQVQSNNILTSSPATYFISATPSDLTSFGLNPTSPARNAGLSTAPVYSDIFRTSRPQLGVIDIGAIEGP